MPENAHANVREIHFLEFHRETFSLDSTSVMRDRVNGATRRPINRSQIGDSFLAHFFSSQPLPSHGLLHGSKFRSENSILFVSPSLLSMEPKVAVRVFE